MKRKTLTVTRTAQNTIDNAGNVITGVSSTFEIKASVQPADRIQMEALPQLRDFKQIFTLFSNSELFTADAENQTESDIVSIYGKDYEVVTVEPWQNGIRSHYKMLVGR